MKPETVPDFVAVLKSFKLLTPERTQELETKWAPQFAKPMHLAWQLLQLAWITPFQVDQILRSDRPEIACGPYRLLARLGQGGVCRVFKAYDTRTEAIVALKVLHDSFQDHPEILRRFRREIETIVRLDHPNIVKAYDVHLSRTTGYLAMEFLAGTDLMRLLERDGPPRIGVACDYVRQAALGLQHVHEEGLVHRDVKPANIFVSEPDAVVKILDLGLVRNQAPRALDPSTSATMEQSTLGTPDYIAPEQARNPRNVDVRTDVYSLGATLYHLLVGKPPFDGGSAMEKLFRHQREEPVRLHRLRPGVPPELSCLVAAMLQKRPDERPRTPGAVAEQLRPFCRMSGHGDRSARL